ncbi:MAG: hypothetical protein ABIF22_00905 [bacterium]
MTEEIKNKYTATIGLEIHPSTITFLKEKVSYGARSGNIIL